MTTAQKKHSPQVTIKDLIQSGAHFGHQTRRWNPKMKRFIFEERGGIYIIACNDDALKSIKVVLGALSEAIVARKNDLQISAMKGDDEGSEVVDKDAGEDQ